MWVLLGVNALWRLAWLPASRGAYTDGILQIDLWRNGLTYWPPLYATLTRLFVLVPGMDLEAAARGLSLVAGTLAVAPLLAIARRLFGDRAALLAAICYTVSPIPLRWSLQVMTDATFAALWMGCLAALTIAASARWPQLFDPGPSAPTPRPDEASKWFLLASLAGALAMLTRYQGILLLPLVALVVWRSGRGAEGPSSAGKYHPALIGLPWVVVPLWFLRQGWAPLEMHLAQIGERTSPGSTAQTLLNYWYVFEEFVLDGPYFVTYGIFGFFLYGLFRAQFATPRLRLSGWVALYLALSLLALQSVFQAFQSRYLLPLVPLVCIAAGHGLAVWERRCKERPLRFWGLAGPAWSYGLVFSSLVAFYQGSPFVDIKEAARWVSREAEPGARLVSTERYNRQIGPAKVVFWSRREVGWLPAVLEAEALLPGDYVILPSFYGGLAAGGWREYQTLKRDLVTRYGAQTVYVAPYVTYPLLPDIMEEPLTHTNPLWWYLRYQPQRFETTVLRIGVASKGTASP